MKASILVILVSLMALSGCKQSSDVAGNGLVQKRKYRKGFNLNMSRNSVKRSSETTSKDTFMVNGENTNLTEVATRALDNVIEPSQTSVKLLSNKASQERHSEPSRMMVIGNDESEGFVHSKEISLVTQPTPNEPGDIQEAKNQLLKSLAINVGIVLALLIATIALLSLLPVFSIIPVWVYFIRTLGVLITPALLGIGVLNLFKRLQSYVRARNGKSFTTKRQDKRNTNLSNLSAILGPLSLGIGIAASLGLVSLFGFLGLSGSLMIFIPILLALTSVIAFYGFFIGGFSAQVDRIKTDRKHVLPAILNVLTFLGLISLFALIWAFLSAEGASNIY